LNQNESGYIILALTFLHVLSSDLDTQKCLSLFKMIYLAYSGILGKIKEPQCELWCTEVGFHKKGGKLSMQIR
jgi:hypothetical protein